MILARLSPYFQPLIPLLTRLREDVILPMHTDSKGNFCHKKPLTHKVLIDAVINSLLALDDDAWRPYKDIEHMTHLQKQMRTRESLAFIELKSLSGISIFR